MLLHFLAVEGRSEPHASDKLEGPVITMSLRTRERRMMSRLSRQFFLRGVIVTATFGLLPSLAVAQQTPTPDGGGLPLSASQPVEETRTDDAKPAEDWSLTPATALRVLDQNEAADFLGTADDYTAALSPLDRQVRVGSTDSVDDATIRAFQAKAAREFSADERASLLRLLAKLRPKLTILRDLFPAEVKLIKTSGEEEGEAAYTRRDAIILPGRMLAQGPEQVEKLLLHELFHILSRHRPDLRRALYREVRFEPIPELLLPADWAARKLTNPDAPHLDVVFTWITKQETGAAGVPLLYAKSAKYDPDTDGGLFDVLNFRLILVEKTEAGWTPVLRDGHPLVADPHALPDYYRAIGRNTDYIIHPEEVLADNFVMLLTGRKDLPDPWLPRRMATHLVRPEALPPSESATTSP